MTTEAVARYKSYGKNATGATTVVVYTCPANFTAKVELVFINNKVNGNVAVSLTWDDNDNGGPFSVLNNYTISAHSFLKLSEGYLVMNTGDTLSLTTPSGANVDIIVSVAEYYDPTQRT